MLPFRIDVENGDLSVGSIRLEPFHDRLAATALLLGVSATFPFGHARTAMLDIVFGGERGILGLGFRDEKLADVNLTLGEWTSGEDAARQVLFVRDVLRRDCDICVGEFAAQFAWGAVYSFLGRGGGALHGLKYGTDAYAAVSNEL